MDVSGYLGVLSVHLDKDFLKKYYDTMLDAALFWVDNLWTDERDGTLVANRLTLPNMASSHWVFNFAGYDL